MKYFILLLPLVYAFQNLYAAENGIKEKIDSVNSISEEQVVSNLKRYVQIFSDNAEEANTIGYTSGEARALLRLSIIYHLSGEYKESTEAIFSAIRILEKTNRVKELALTYGSYGYQIKRRDIMRAVEFMQRGITIAEANNMDSVLTILYDNYGVLHEMQNSLDSAAYFYNKSLQLKYVFKDTAGVPYSLNKIAGIYAQKKNYDKAFYYMNESDKYRIKEKGDFGRAENSVMWGDILLHKGDADAAAEKFKDGIRLSEKINYTPIKQYCLEQLSAIYQNKNDFEKAFRYYKDYISLRDSLLNNETNLKIAELEINYETEKKDRLIAENELKIKQSDQQLQLMGIALIFLVILSVLIYYFQIQKRNRIQKELELKDLLKQAELKKKVIDEKLRISRELHDNIGSQITFLISSIDNLTFSPHSFDQKGSSKLKEISSFARTTMNELRNTIWVMKQEDADISYLIYKLQELKQGVNSNIENIHIEINNCITSHVVLSTSKMLNLYRIVQEAIQNVIKHSSASRVEINFRELDNKLLLKISDNGKGFDKNTVANGNGLINMKARCEEIGGDFYVESSEQGTIINCTLSK